MQIWLGGQWFTVIGVLDPIPLVPSLDLAALIGWQAGERYLDSEGEITTLYVRANPGAVEAVRPILADMKINLVLSGVNKGQNIAEDVTYSGTVAGAMEGTILGIPSVALSQCYTAATRDNPSYAVAETHGPNLIRRLLKLGMPEGVLVNVNFPPCKPEEVAGIAITTQGRRDPELLKIEPRFDGRNNPYYWIGFSRKQYDLPNGSDMQAGAPKSISVTPLLIHMTDEPFMTHLAQDFAAPKK